jgi:TPR repeat protein
MKNIILTLSLLIVSIYADTATISNDFIKYKKGTYSKYYISLVNKCDNGNMKACYRLGSINFYGGFVEKDHETALKYFKKSCSNNNAEGCYALANNRFRVNSINIWKIDGFKKVELLDKSCNLRNASACFILALKYTKTQPMAYKLDGIKRNLITAKSLFELSCEYGVELACTKYNELKAQGIK